MYSNGGGLVGDFAGGQFQNSFWDVNTTGVPNGRPVGSGSKTVTNSRGLTTAELQQEATYTTTYSTDWDFDNVWVIDEGNTYPELRGAGPSISAGPNPVNATDGLGDRVIVTWPEVAQAAAYGVYRSPGPDSSRELLGWSSTLSFEDVTGIADTAYHYYVTAAYTLTGAGESDVEHADSDIGTALYQAATPENVIASTSLPELVSIYWDQLSGGDFFHYQVSRSDTESGTRSVINSWATDLVAFDTPPEPNQDYYYWVQAAADSSGSGASEYSAFAVGQMKAVPRVSLTIAKTSVVEADGSQATTATVSRNTDTTNALTVTLFSNDTTEATVAGSIVIPAGQTSITFDVAAVDDAILDCSQTVTITASAVDHASGAASLDVTDDDGRDYGDAPDPGTGTGQGNYETLASTGGASHRIFATQSTLFLGNSVDCDPGTLQNAAANSDDVDGALPDDEDGILDPLDLFGTEGAAPTITLLATNTTGGAATLSGWIDYNQDGVFDNATERAQVAVPAGTADDRFTLTFPEIPNGAAGTTYARFRLSTDAAAENSKGAADDGEVEDYTFSITAQSSGTADHLLKIAHETNGGPTLTDGDNFGGSVTFVGDLDGDGVADLAVGAAGDDTGGPRRGAVHVLLLNDDSTVKSSTKIASGTNGGPTLADYDSFGSSLSGVGDLDGDGVADLAVGTPYDTGGAVHVLLLNGDGTVKSSTKIAHELNGGPTLADGAAFGHSVASIGDLDGDGVADLAVGANGDDAGGTVRGAVHILLLNANGTVKSSTTIAHELNGGPTLQNSDFFGWSVAGVGDLDGDGVADLAVGAIFDETSGADRGAVHVLLLNANGTVKSATKIVGGPTHEDVGAFGYSVASVGDLDGDGVADLAVGANDTNGTRRGAVHVLLLNADGTVKSATEIASDIGGGPTLAEDDYFGSSVAVVGDLDGDGVADLAVGAQFNDTDGTDRGAVYLMNLAQAPGVNVTESDGMTLVSESGSTDTVTVVLESRPQSNVALTVLSADTEETTVDKATLTFTPENWDAVQTVTVTGVHDMTVDGNQTTLVTISVDDANSDDAFDSLEVQTVSVTTTDDDGAVQRIAADTLRKAVAPGRTIDIPIIYQTLDPSGNPAALQTTLISFNLHFDSNELTFVESTNLFSEGLQAVPNITRLESDESVIGDDNDTATDRVVVASYTDTDSALNPGWPNNLSSNGQILYVARFTASADFTGTTVNFSENVTGNVVGGSQQFIFQSDSVVIEQGINNPGNVDGDDDFDANDSFLMHLTKLSGTNAQIDQSKGSSSMTAAEIRSAIAELDDVVDVDGDQNFDANDSFLIHLVKLSGTNAQIDQSKGSSSLTATEIRARINVLGGGAAPQVVAASPQVLESVLSGDSHSNNDSSVPATPLHNMSPGSDSSQTPLFPFVDPDAEPVVTNSAAAILQDSAAEFEGEGFRQWIDAI